MIFFVENANVYLYILQEKKRQGRFDFSTNRWYNVEKQKVTASTSNTTIDLLKGMVYDTAHFKVNGVERVSFDYQFVRTSLETLYINSRLRLPLKGILLIGY